MTYRFLFVFLMISAFAEDGKTGRAIDFQKDVLPILRDNCLACHNATKAKARLVLEEPATILKGGESGPAAIPGKGAESLLLKSSAHLAEPFMPPESNNVGAKNLTPEQLNLLRAWIDQGATGQVRIAMAPLKWQPLPLGFAPINAVTITEDGQFAACGRANQIFVYHLPSGELAACLTDPALNGLAHHDVVQSLAFNPPGTLLASGGYRAIKLWRRAPILPEKNLPSEEQIHSLATSPDGQWIAVGVGEHGLKLCDSSGETVREFQGHTAHVTAVRFSPDGSQLCSGSGDKTLRVWSVADARLITNVVTDFEINAVAWLAKGTEIAAAGRSPAIHIWRIAPTEPNAIRKLEGHTAEITSLDAIEGTKLLSGSRDGSVRLWDVVKGELIRQFDHGGPVTAVAFRPDGKRLLSGGENKIARLWDGASSNLVAELKGDRYRQEELGRHDRTLSFVTNEVAFHKTALQNAEKLQLTETENLKKATTAREASEKALAENTAATRKAAEESDLAKKSLDSGQAAAKLASQNKESASNLVMIATAQVQAATDLLKQSTSLIKNAEEAHESAFQSVLKSAQDPTNRVVIEQAIDRASSAKTSLANARAARETAERTLNELNALLKQNTEAKSLAEKNLEVASTHEKERLAASQQAEKNLAAANTALQKSQAEKSKADDVLQFAQQSLKKAEEGVLNTRKTLSSAEEAVKLAEINRAAVLKAELETHSPIRAVAFSPDNKLAASTDESGQLHLWNAETGAPHEVASASTNSALSAFLTGSSIITSSADGLKIWNPQNRWQLERIIGSEDNSSPIEDRVLALAFSPDGELIASGGGMPSRGGEIAIWKASDGSLVRSFKDPHSDTVYALDFSADQKFLASGGADKFARIFDLNTGALVRSFEGHTHHVLGVSWKRDGRSLASAGADKVIKIWNTATGEQRKTISGFAKEINSVHFLDASGQALISAGDPLVRLVREDGENNVRNFEGATDFITSAQPMPDGKLVAAGSQDGILRIWDGKTGKLLFSFAP